MVGPLVKAKYPGIQREKFNQALVHIWSEMPVQEKDKYRRMAEQASKEAPAPPSPAHAPAPTAPLELEVEEVVAVEEEQVTLATLDTVAADYPMFPLYFKNMRSTLRKLYPGEGEDQLRLRAWTMATRAAGKGPLANTGNQGLEKKVEEARTESNIDVVKDDKPKEVEEAPKPSEETSET